MKLQGDVRRYQGNERELQNEVKHYKARLEECSQEHLASLKAELAASRQEVAKLKERAEDFTDRERELESKIVDYRYELEQLQDTLSGKKEREEHEKEKRRIEMLSHGGQHEMTVEEELTNLKYQLEELGEKYENLKRIADNDGADLYQLNLLCQDQEEKVGSC